MKNIMECINGVVGFTIMLFMMGIIISPFLWIQIVSFISIVIVMSIYFGIYIYWMIHDPNRLQ